MKSKAPNQPDFGLQYDADGMILDPHPPLSFDPDAMSSLARKTASLETQTINATETVYVVRDGAGEYLSGKHEGKRTPAADEAREFETREEAEAACNRATDRVLTRNMEA